MSYQSFPKNGPITDGYVLIYSGADGYYKPQLVSSKSFSGVLSLAHTQAQRPQIPDRLPSCIHRWLCNEPAGTGTITDDGSAADSTLTVQNPSNTTQGITGIYCSGVSFFGAGGATSGWAKSAANVGAPSSTTLLTLHGWVKCNSFSNAYAHFIGRAYSTATNSDDSVSFYLNNTTGQLITRWNSGGITKGGVAISTARAILLVNTWYYLGVTFSQAGSNMTVNYYKDGNLVGTSVVASGAFDWNGASAGAWSLGTYNSGLWTAATLNGFQFDWRVEDGVALTQAQMLANYKKGMGLIY